MDRPTGRADLDRSSLRVSSQVTPDPAKSTIEISITVLDIMSRQGNASQSHREILLYVM